MYFEINLNNLLFYSFHGVYEEERITGNEFVVNLSVSIACLEDNKKDDLDKTVSYAFLYEIVAQEMEKPRKLLETVCLDIAEKIKSKQPGIIKGKVTIEKRRPPISGMLGSASVTLNF